MRPMSPAELTAAVEHCRMYSEDVRDKHEQAIVQFADQRDRALELLHRYVDGLPPQKPTSLDRDTQDFLAEVDG